MDEQEKFTVLVMMLAENSERGNLELNEEITNFEDAIKFTGRGEAYFGTAKSNSDRIDIISPDNIPYKYRQEGTKFYAEYYDGMQAPFLVCKWNDEYEKLEELLKQTSDILYSKYVEITEKEKELW